MSWEVVYSKNAIKDAKKISKSGLKSKVIALLNIIKENPFTNPPHYEKLVGDLKGLYSRRINLQHRLIYEVFEDKKIIRILKMWTHYE